MESNSEVEERLFEGVCQTLVIPQAPDDCECFLTSDGEEKLDQWQNEPLPPPQCSDDSCSGQGKGGEYDYDHGSCMSAFVLLSCALTFCISATIHIIFVSEHRCQILISKRSMVPSTIITASVIW